VSASTGTNTTGGAVSVESPASPGASPTVKPTARQVFFADQGRVAWSAAVLLGGLFLLLQTYNITYRASPNELGPAFWPRVWLALLVLVAAYDGWEAFRRSRRERGEQPALGGPAAVTSPAIMDAPVGAKPEESWRLLLAGAVIVVAYVFATTVLGFMLATPIFLAVFIYLGGFRKVVPLVLIAVGATATLLFLFVRLVYVSLPLGQGPFSDFTVAVYQLLGLF
jgi:putative tricarboxylic transport membrane protein